MGVRAIHHIVVVSLMSGFMAPAMADDIKIGFTGPITGPASFLGQQMKWGAETAVAEINAKGGVLGRKVSFVMQDSGCRPADAVAGAEKLISQDQVDVLLGDICSGATTALMPVAEKAKKPLIVSVSTLPDITAKAGIGGNIWVFRSVPNDLMMGKVVAAEMTPYKSIAVLAEDTDYGRTGIKLLKDGLRADSKIVSEDYVKPSETDFLPMMTKYRSLKPDAIAIYMLDQQGANVMKQYVQFGLTMPLVGRPPLVSPLVQDLLATGKFNGSWTVYPYFADYKSPANDAFAGPFKETYKQAPHYVAYGIHESILIAADAIGRAGTTAPEAVQAALTKTNFTGILGPLTFDDHDQSANNLMFITVENGKAGVKSLIPSK